MKFYNISYGQLVRVGVHLGCKVKNSNFYMS